MTVALIPSHTHYLPFDPGLTTLQSAFVTCTVSISYERDCGEDGRINAENLNLTE